MGDRTLATSVHQIMKSTPCKSTNGESMTKMRLRCLVERVTGAPSVNGSAGSNHRLDSTLEFDSHISIDPNTSFHSVVETAMRSLGFPDSLFVGARGSIEIKNWKPMTLESVTENLSLTVSDVLGNICEHVTLRIRLCSSMKQWIVADVKQKLLSFLLENSQELLLRSGCPIKKSMVDQIYDETSQLVLSEDFRKEFNDWYQQQMRSDSQPVNHCHRLNFHKLHNGDVSDTASIGHGHAPLLGSPERMNAAVPCEGNGATPSTPHSRSMTYIRTWFDPETEIPRLQSWLRENKHPTKADLIQYLNVLNSQDYRKRHRPLDLSNLSYWFKNARARSSQNRHSESNCTNGSSDADKGSNSDSSTSNEQKCANSKRFQLNDDVSHKDSISAAPDKVHLYNGIKGSQEDGLINDRRHRNNISMSPLRGHIHKDENDRKLADFGKLVEDRKLVDFSSEHKWNSDDSSDTMKNMNNSNGKIGHDEPSDKNREQDADRFKSDDEGDDNDDTVPDLPNKNAVYVIKPLHASNKMLSANTSLTAQSKTESLSSNSPIDSAEDDEDDDDDANHARSCDQMNDSSPIALKRQRIEMNRNDEPKIYSGNNFHSSKHDVNHNRALQMNGCDTEIEATDLSVRSLSRQNPDNSGEGSSRSSSRQMFNECEERSRSSSSSPPGENGVTHPPQFSLPPHLHMLHQQHALQMAAMSHAMRFMHPSMFGNGASPRSNGLFLPPPIPFSSGSALSAVQASAYNDDQDSCGSINGDSYSLSDRKKRSRVFIDPLSEIPKLEQWFLEDSHPSSFVIEQFTDELNRSAYRQRFPRLEPKNVQLWFKNHRAKVKRQRHELSTASSNSDMGTSNERASESELDDSIGMGRDSLIDNKLLHDSQKVNELYRNGQYWQGQNASLKCELNGDC